MLSHINAKNQPAMVDVGEKPVTARNAHAVAVVTLPPELARLIVNHEITGKKGPVFQTSSIAGVMAAKRTSELIPLCHLLPLDDCQVEIKAGPADARGAVDVVIHCRASTHAKTGVEMEALTGASVAALTLYDMGKAVSHEIVIKEIRLIEKTGGKSDYRSEAEY
ncbi:cyclic pyranopterin monophosphate synthase MoaC [Opitutaceae bacterium EW11]|nr:cyclic pyranopterin monophosphate synthase MoaC [Opitutaceae bacterium EW11]